MYNLVEHFLQAVLAALAGFTHDWGSAIVLLTAAVRLLLLPLSLQALRNIQLHTAVGAQLREMAANWSGSKTELAAEQQKLLRQHGIHPSGSLLLPMLQAPVLYLIYQVFRTLNHPVVSVLLPWLPLTAADPWHLVPLVAGALLFLAGLVTYPPRRFNQKFMGASISGFIGLAVLWHTPAAVALYYVTSGLWSAGERGLLGRLYKPVVTAA
ncbi:MAG: membrane protein insertase YidC [Alicyclobacillus herbarius]|uniref:membrane protein insertase YidC n=1 Tax=Alicyclobacillus herbarius TaxID=122960 RepID=UPI0023552CB4|nr:membrane protein insertase YidC [Alicyclobacillus herbarius]MCL6633027.1 membrane protein insertase YidC [Alicyclobacillus herbarius]